MNTEELLRPAAEEVVPNGFWRRLFRMHEHCFHATETLRSNRHLERTCCHCGRREESDLQRVPVEHGVHAPKSVPLPYNWSEWKKAAEGGY